MLILNLKIARKNLEYQIIRSMKKMLTNNPHTEINFNNILKAAQVSKERFYKCYKNKIEFLKSINIAYLDTLKEKIPYVKSKEDLLDLTDNLVEITNCEGSISKFRILLKINKSIDSENFLFLKDQLSTFLNSRLHFFFKKMQSKTDSLNVYDFKTTLSNVFDDSLMYDRFKNFHLIVFCLRSLNIIFD